MASLFSRLAKGLGEGMQVVGQMGLEEQRQKRYAKMQETSRSAAAQESREFSTSERKASEKFTASEKALDRDARLQGRESQDKVKFRDIDEMSGKTTITYESGRREEYDPETDTTRSLGEGKAKLSDESKGEDKTWGEKMANREAGTFSGDASDFPLFKSEEKAAEAAAQFRSNARRKGTIDKFDTEFAKRGWSYIQELAQPVDETKALQTLADNAAKEQRASTKGDAASEGLMAIFKDFDSKDYDGIANQIIADSTAPEALKKEARDYLSKGQPRRNLQKR